MCHEYDELYWSALELEHARRKEEKADELKRQEETAAPSKTVEPEREEQESVPA